MAYRFLACALVVCGCDLDFGLDQGPTAHLYDNGVRLRITACPDAAFLSCATPMRFEWATAVVDGLDVPLPLSSSNAPNDADSEIDPDGIPPITYAYDTGAFAAEVASPASSSIGVSIDGNGTTVTEPAPFAVNAPASANRSAGAVTVSWDPLANAVANTTEVFVVSACGSDSSLHDASPADDSSHQTQIDLSELALPVEGACTHTVQVAQFAWLDKNGAISVSILRIGLATIASQP